MGDGSGCWFCGSLDAEPCENCGLLVCARHRKCRGTPRRGLASNVARVLVFLIERGETFVCGEALAVAVQKQARQEGFRVVTVSGPEPDRSVRLTLAAPSARVWPPQSPVCP